VDSIKLKQLISDELSVIAINDMRMIMSTEYGRRFIQWLIMQCGQQDTSFTKDSRTFFLEGMRNVALIIEKTIVQENLNGLKALHKSEVEYLELKETLAEKQLNKKKEEC